MCFGEFAVTDDISNLEWIGGDDAILHLYGIIGLILALLSGGNFLLFHSWHRRRLEGPMQQARQKLATQEADWKRQRLQEVLQYESGKNSEDQLHSSDDGSKGPRSAAVEPTVPLESENMKRPLVEAAQEAVQEVSGGSAELDNVNTSAGPGSAKKAKPVKKKAKKPRVKKGKEGHSEDYEKDDAEEASDGDVETAQIQPLDLHARNSSAEPDMDNEPPVVKDTRTLPCTEGAEATVENAQAESSGVRHSASRKVSKRPC